MDNLGIAKVSVELYTGALPNMNKLTSHYDFDISAFNWDAIKSSNLFTPLFLEQVADANGGFAAIMPSKRKWYINNFMNGSKNLTSANVGGLPFITWAPLAKVFGSFADKIKDYNT